MSTATIVAYHANSGGFRITFDQLDLTQYKSFQVEYKPDGFFIMLRKEEKRIGTLDLTVHQPTPGKVGPNGKPYAPFLQFAQTKYIGYKVADGTFSATPVRVVETVGDTLMVHVATGKFAKLGGRPKGVKNAVKAAPQATSSSEGPTIPMGADVFLELLKSGSLKLTSGIVSCKDGNGNSLSVKI